MARKEKLFTLPNVDVEFRVGPITEADVDVIVNSANGTMIHGSGTAADINNASGKLTTEEMKEYALIVEKMPGTAGRVYREVWALTQAGKYRQPLRLQFECAKVFLTNNGVPLDRGQIALTSSGELATKGGAKWVVHAVCMTYDFESKEEGENGRPPIIPADSAIIELAISKSLDLIKEKNLGISVAIPIMSVRKGGVAPEESLQGIRKGLEKHLEKGSGLEKIVIVGDNPISADFITNSK